MWLHPWKKFWMLAYSYWQVISKYSCLFWSLTLKQITSAGTVLYSSPYLLVWVVLNNFEKYLKLARWRSLKIGIQCRLSHFLWKNNIKFLRIWLNMGKQFTILTIYSGLFPYVYGDAQSYLLICGIGLMTGLGIFHNFMTREIEIIWFFRLHLTFFSAIFRCNQATTVSNLDRKQTWW